MRRMYNLYYAMLGLTLAVAGCMAHAAARKHWHMVQGAVPLLIGFLALAIAFGAAK
jgi:hypothetical protein